MTDKKPKVFQNCYIEDPRILSEQILTENIFNGSLTFPLVDTTKSEADVDIYTVPFVMDNEFGFSLGNEWGTLVPDMAKDLGEFLSSMNNLAAYGKIGGYEGPQISLISRAMSVATWKGSQLPTFTINVTFVATRRSYNPVEIIKAISATCLPTMMKNDPSSAQEIKTKTAEKLREVANWTDSVGSSMSSDNHPIVSGVLKGLGALTNTTAKAIQNSGLIAPLRYAPTVDLNNDSVSFSEDCTISLQIGQWFYAEKLVVENISNIQFSKEVIAPQPEWLYKDSGNSIYHKTLTALEKQGQWGFPLYAKCTITLRPTHYITYEEFLKYFKECPKKEIKDVSNIQTVEKTTIKDKIKNTANKVKTKVGNTIFNSKYNKYNKGNFPTDDGTRIV